jgi:hypothetical protein
LAGRARALRIIDATGCVVWRFMAPHGLARQVRWDGRSMQGDLVPAGVYFYEISSPGQGPVAGKVIKLR